MIWAKVTGHSWPEEKYFQSLVFYSHLIRLLCTDATCFYTRHDLKIVSICSRTLNSPVKKAKGLRCRKASLRSAFGNEFVQMSDNLWLSTSLSRRFPSSPCWLEASRVVLATLPLVSIPFPATLLLQCTHIQGRDYHSPFAVTLSTDATFTDVLHSRVIDHTLRILLCLDLRWIRWIRTQRVHWLIGSAILLRLFYLIEPAGDAHERDTMWC